MDAPNAASGQPANVSSLCITMRQYSSILTFLFTFAYSISNGQTGTIRGNVYDKIAQNRLFGSLVKVDELKKAALTDLDGNFQFDSIPPGTYSLNAQYVMYGDTTIYYVVVVADSVTIVNFILPPPCSYDLNIADKTCPICRKKNKVVPIVYGLPIGPVNKKRYYYAGCAVTKCDPHWYCKRDKHKF